MQEIVSAMRKELMIFYQCTCKITKKEFYIRSGDIHKIILQVLYQVEIVCSWFFHSLTEYIKRSTSKTTSNILKLLNDSGNTPDQF